MNKSPLTGIRVIDMSQFLPGPYATQMLADMGADVLKVEPPDGDPICAVNPITNARTPSPFHKLINAGKRVVRIDLKSDDGNHAFKKLVSKADVLLESFRPGVMHRLGLSYGILTKLNPRLIHCALSGYGQTGPQKGRSGHDINYLASSGGLSVTGSQSKPQPAFPPVADYGGAMQATIAVQSALIGRATDGKGSYLDVAMADTMLSWQSLGLVQQSLSEQTEQEPPARAQNLLNGGAACYQVYESSDHNFVSLGAIERHFWENFCDAVDRKLWINRQSDPLPQTELLAEVTKLFLSRTKDQWDDVLRDIDCCYHPVLSYAELAQWPQFQQRKMIDTNSDNGEFMGLRFPVWQNGEPPSKRQPMREINLRDALDAWSTETRG